MKIATFIFARGGSKGIPKKNIKIFCGKPLIAWSIEQALGVRGVDEVFVSTDSQEIASVAKYYGAKVPFIRPVELSGDQSPEWAAWQHALNFFKIEKGFMPDAFLSIPTTSPLRAISDIENCLLKFEECNPDAVITITNSHRNPFFNMVKIDDNGACLPVSRADSSITRRQDATVVFDMTTVAYVVKPRFICESEHLFNGNVQAVHIPPDRALDIDTLFDFEIAEFLFKKKKLK
jgi:CMP-N-acetylneuraminic acid synthetase